MAASMLVLTPAFVSSLYPRLVCTMFQDKLPSNLTYGYDFRETSAASHAVVVEKVKKADFGQDHDYTGLLLPTAMPHVH